jgi:hypothetical protein
VSQHRDRGRRRFLRGLGGAALALPFLHSLERESGAAPPPIPKRLVIMHYAQGTLLRDDDGNGLSMPDEWTPSGTGKSFALSPILDVLEPMKNKILVLSGVNNTASAGGHSESGRSLLTGVPIAATNAPASGPSIDQIIGHHISNQVALPHPILNLSSGSDFGGENQLLWDEALNEVPARWDPMDTFQTVFSGLQVGPEPPPPTTADLLRRNRRSVLDAVRGSLGSLGRRVARDDRLVLEAHADKIRELERQIGAVGTNPSAGCEMPDPTGFPDPDWTHETIDVEDQVAAAHIKLMAMAMACDLTRCATFQFTNYDGPRFAFLEDEGLVLPHQGKEWHALIHENRFDASSRAIMRKAFRWYNGQFLALLEELDSFPDGEGTTVLDNTLVLLVSEFGNGGTHSPDSLPIVLAGGLGGAIEMGRHVSKPNGSTGSLFTTIQNLFGVEGNWADNGAYDAMSL